MKWFLELLEIMMIKINKWNYLTTTITLQTLARYGVSPPSVGQGGGGWCDPPWRFQTKRRRAWRKRPVDCSRRVLAIGGIIFGPRSIFDPVMAGQRSFFWKFYDFSNLRVHISNTIYRSGMGPSPACSPFHSAQNEVFWCISVEYLGRIVLIDDAVSHRWRHRSDLWRFDVMTKILSGMHWGKFAPILGQLWPLKKQKKN